MVICAVLITSAALLVTCTALLVTHAVPLVAGAALLVIGMVFLVISAALLVAGVPPWSLMHPVAPCNAFSLLSWLRSHSHCLQEGHELH